MDLTSGSGCICVLAHCASQTALCSHESIIIMYPWSTYVVRSVDSLVPVELLLHAVFLHVRYTVNTYVVLYRMCSQSLHACRHRSRGWHTYLRTERAVVIFYQILFQMLIHSSIMFRMMMIYVHT